MNDRARVIQRPQQDLPLSRTRTLHRHFFLSSYPRGYSHLFRDPSKLERLKVWMPDSSQRLDKRDWGRYAGYTDPKPVTPWRRYNLISSSIRTSLMEMYLWSIHNHRRFNRQLALLRLAVQQCYLGGKDYRLSYTKLIF